MEAYQIVLLIVVILAFIYAGAAIYVMSHAVDFRFKLKKRGEALCLVFALKKERIVEVFSILEKRGVSLSEDDAALLKKYKLTSFKKLKEKELFEAIELTKTIQARMSYNLQQAELEDMEIKAASNAIKDINTFYRASVVLYNSDVKGYDYWINVPLCRWMPFVFGLHKRKIIG